MNHLEYVKYMADRQIIIDINRVNRIKGLPSLPVPPKLEPPKVRIAYSKNDNSYIGRLKDGEECPEDCYVKFEPALY
jgi:hypothetical protein